MLINGAFGLGENVVQGSVNPDEFYGLISESGEFEDRQVSVLDQRRAKLTLVDSTRQENEFSRFMIVTDMAC